LLQAVNSPKRPYFCTRLLPHCGHFSSSGTSGFLLRAADLLGGLAVRVAGAGENVPKRPFFSTMGRPQFSQYLVALLGKIGLVDVRQIHRQLARVGALRVAGAGDEAAVLAPLDDQGLPHFSQIKSVGFSIRLMSVMCSSACFEVLHEALVELAHGLAPVELAFFDLVELLFHARRVAHVEDVVEAFEQQVGHHHAQLGGLEFAAFLGDVLALLNGGKNRRVGGRAAHAVGFQLLDQRGFVVARRRLGEMLLGLRCLEASALAFGHGRQLVLQLLVFLVLLVLAFFVDLEEAVELHGRAGGAEE
jgi:hypothetical protein